jgi:hypothetical protein
MPFRNVTGWTLEMSPIATLYPLSRAAVMLTIQIRCIPWFTQDEQGDPVVIRPAEPEACFVNRSKRSGQLTLALLLE